ncbi:MAG TPA: autotransporter domain-containing protein, partial [Steroidobacteraceae bacterium]|nr:autotransporter domain-containing protein [Steroidobacteraceae bacterium]
PPNNAPVANAGPDRSIADTDLRPGERITLDASASTDADGTITSYTWFQGDTTLGTGRVLTNVALPNGQNTITLVVTDNSNNASSDTVLISVAEPLPRAKLSEVALTPSQKSMAQTLDDLCSRLVPELPVITLQQVPAENVAGFTSAFPFAAGSLADTDDLASRCFGILSDRNAANQRKALDELSAQEFNAMRTPTVVFSQTQFQSILDRLVALRAGERGTSVAGLNMRIGDSFVSLEDIAGSLRDAFGGGASSDESESGGLLGDRLGVWMRGNYGVGEKSRTDAGIGFDSDQWGLSGGVDYRFGQAAVAGVSLGYGKSQIDFTPESQGGIDTESLAASIYGSGYVGGLYLDGVLNYIDSDYDSARHINYLEGATTIDRIADGATSGDAFSGGAALGYDFVIGAFTLAPSIGYYYVDTVIDPFVETNAGGLNLAFEEQNYKSSAANAGVRASYAWKTSWGVFIPHFRGTYVREFEDSAEVFGVRFANDPFASSANPTPPIIVESDRIDHSYLRLAAGASAQFAFGISGYFEYQRLEAYEQVDFHDFTVGLRLHRGF